MTTPSIGHEELDQLLRGEHGQPHALLGPHPGKDSVTIRAFKPLAERVEAVYGDQRVRLEHEYEGFWTGTIKGTDVPGYRLEVTYDGHTQTVDDPYRFLPTLGEVDLHLINEGRHEQLWDVLGAHVQHYTGPLGDTVSGTSFAVWAPSARGVRV